MSCYQTRQTECGCFFKLQNHQGRPKSYLQMGEMGALENCFIDIKQVKSRFFSRNHRHEALETGDFPHLRLHWGPVAGPGQASPSAAQPTSEVGAIKAGNYCSRFKGSSARPILQMLRLGLPLPGVTAWASWRVGLRQHKTPTLPPTPLPSS